MMRRLMTITTIMALNVLSWQAHAELRSEITEYGYYQQVGELERERNFNTATGYVRTGTDVQLVEQTAEIPMALGRLFGFKFRIRGFPRDEVTVNLDLAVTHPEIVRPNGTRVSGYRYPVTMDVIGGKIEKQTGYKFDRDYEMVAGKWTFQYWRGETLLLEQTFDVYDPTLAPASENNVGETNVGQNNVREENAENQLQESAQMPVAPVLVDPAQP
jgi:hypothetical protein